jgi:hypothetical protein
MEGPQFILNLVGFEVLTAVVMKSTIFWDVTPCSPLKVNRCFGGTYGLHFHGEKWAEQETSVRAGGKQSLLCIREIQYSNFVS